MNEPDPRAIEPANIGCEDELCVLPPGHEGYHQLSERLDASIKTAEALRAAGETILEQWDRVRAAAEG